ncbi:DUF5313 family protein [Streptosporangium sp. NPDC004631]
MTSDVTSAYERRCRSLMRLAYPPRFREFRGAELLGTLMDLAEPGQSSPTLRDRLDVLRGGLVLRLREHPPLWRWLLYRMLGSRLPWRYRWWARDDIQGRFFLERRFIFNVLLWDLYSVLVRLPMPYWVLPGVITLTYLLSLTAKDRRRRLFLAKHEFHPDGTSYVPRPPGLHPDDEVYAPRPDHVRRMGWPGR